MKSILATLTAVLLAGSVIAATMPPLPRQHLILRSPKDQGNQPIRLYWPVLELKQAVRAARAVPSQPPLYFVNYGPGVIQPGVAASGTNLMLIVPASAPQLYIPNSTQAPFAVLQSSPTVLGPWTTLGYFTNCVNGFYIVDVTATNKPMYFYRLVPQ